MLETTTYIECQTVCGQILRVECDSSKVEEIKSIFKSSIEIVRPTITKKTEISHGWYCRYSRFDIVQHKYAANMTNYRELLEIKDPIEEKASFVIHEGPSNRYSYFTEWKSLEEAKKAFEDYPASYSLGFNETLEEVFEKMPGFIRKVDCGHLEPWFYAVGSEQIVGDYTVPEHLSDDPVYRLGRKFLVYSKNGTPSIKTCLGCRFIEEKTESSNWPYSRKKNKCYFRLVYFSDGTVWDETGRTKWFMPKDGSQPPTPIDSEELWVEQAMQDFKEILSGKERSFSINFTNGTVFNGKVSKGRVKKHCEAGDYLLSVLIKGEDKPMEGWVNGFKPTVEYPDVISFVRDKYEKGKKPIERIEVLKSKKDGKDRKWSGVFFDKRPSVEPEEKEKESA